MPGISRASFCIEKERASIFQRWSKMKIYAFKFRIRILNQKIERVVQAIVFFQRGQVSFSLVIASVINVMNTSSKNLTYILVNITFTRAVILMVMETTVSCISFTSCVQFITVTLIDWWKGTSYIFQFLINVVSNFW